MRRGIGFAALLVCLSACSSMQEREDISLALEQKLEEQEKISQEWQKEHRKLSLEEAIAVAKERNTKIQEAALRKEMAKLDKHISFGNFLPHISAFYNRSFLEYSPADYMGVPQGVQDFVGGLAGLPYIGGVGTAMQNMGRKTFDHQGLNATWAIFAPATWYLYSAREKGEDISKLAYELTEKMISMKVIQDYYSFLALRAEQAGLVEAKKKAEQLERNAKVALETESILPWQYDKVKAYLAKESYDLAENERALRLAKMQLATDLNLSPWVDFEIEEVPEASYDMGTLEDKVYTAVIRSDALAMRARSIEIQEDKIKIALSRFLPIVGAQGMLLHPGMSGLAKSNILFGSLLSSLSLFQGFQDVNQYKKEKVEKKALFLKEEEEILKTMLETTNCYFKLQDAMEVREMAATNLRAEEGMWRQKTLEKEVGMIDELAYLDALEEYEEAAAMKRKANYQYRVYQEALDMLTKEGRFQEKEKQDGGQEDE